MSPYWVMDSSIWLLVTGIGYRRSTGGAAAAEEHLPAGQRTGSSSSLNGWPVVAENGELVAASGT